MIETPQRQMLAEAGRLVRGIATLPSLLASAPRLPRGRGERVLVLPGFLTGDRSTAALRTFLSLMGYRVMGWQLGTNRGNVRKLVPKVADRIADIAREADAPIKVVGWSLGGVLAREATRLAPQRVDHIVTMGTPIIGGPKYTVAGESYRRRGLDLDEIERQAAAANAEPLPVRITALYSRVDAVVAWKACIDDNPHNDVEHIEVGAGHLELGFSPEVFRIVADRLARAP